jgi:hypothetical protein
LLYAANPARFTTPASGRLSVDYFNKCNTLFILLTSRKDYCGLIITRRQFAFWPGMPCPPTGI